MTQSLKILEGGQGAILSIATEYRMVVRENLVDATIDAMINDLRVMFPGVTITNREGVHITNLNHAMVCFICGVYSADADRLNLIAEDGNLQLKLSNKVPEHSILLTWLITQRIVEQYRVITENTLLIMNTSENMLAELISY